MNPTVHLFKKDSLYLKELLCIWLLILGLDLVQLLVFQLSDEAIYATFKIRSHGTGIGPSFLLDLISGLLVFAIYIMTFLLPSLVGLADSPSAEEGFLSTRPIKRKHAVTAKFLCVTVWIVVPLILQETIHLLAVTRDLGLTWQGGLDRLFYMAAIAYAALFFAMLWPHSRVWMPLLIGWIGIYIAAGMVTFAGIILAARLFNWRFHIDMDHARMWQAIWVMTVGLFWLGRVHSKRVLSIRGRMGWVAAICILAHLCGYAFSILNPFPPEGQQPERVTQMVSKSNVEYPGTYLDGQFLLNDTSPKKPLLQLGIAPELTGLPEDWLVEWRNPRCHLVLPDGTIIPSRQRPPSSGRHVYSSHSVYSQSQADMESILPFFPDDVTFQSSTSMRQSGQGMFAVFDTIPESSGESLKMDWEVDGFVFQWVKLGEMSLVRDAEFRDETGSCRVLTGIPNHSGGISLVIERKQLWFMTSQEPLLNKSIRWPNDRFQFMLYFPDSKWVVLPEPYYSTLAVRGDNTSYVSGVFRLDFYQTNPMNLDFTFPSTGDVRLIVFSKNFMGQETIRSTTPAFTMESFQHNENNIHSMETDSISLEVFRERLKNLKRPEPLSDRRELALFIYEVCKLIEQKKEYVTDHHPLVLEVSTYVATHPEVFLDGLKVAQHYSARFLSACLSRGLQEKDKDLVIDRLRQSDRLAEIVIERGWMEDARETLYDIIQGPRQVGWNIMRCVAWFEDPATYPAMLETLKEHPTIPLFELVQSLDIPEQDLDEAVKHIWQNRLRTFDHAQRSDNAFAIALKHGMREALEHGFHLLNLIKPPTREHAWGLIHPLRDAIVLDALTPGMRHDDAQTLKVLEAIDPEDLVYDPILKKFVLNDSISSPL